MLTPSFSWRVALLCWLLLALAAVPGIAQRQYATQLVSYANTANPQAAIDGASTTEATLAPSLALGLARLRVAFPARVPVGERAGLVLRAGNLLGLAALSSLRIRTYLGSASTAALDDIPLSSLITLDVLNAGVATVEFPVNKPFDQIELRAAGLLNVYSIGLIQAYATVSPLPVELVSFQGQATAAGVQLSWQTASELRNSHFVVERATDAQASEFAALGQVAGAGSSTQAQHYRFTDPVPAPLGYYRLRQVDADGRATFSPVLTVRAASPDSQLAAYPSPATETLTIAGPPGAHLALYNQQGRRLHQAELVPGQPLDVRQLPAGLYFVRDAATGQSTRFVKAGSR